MKAYFEASERVLNSYHVAVPLLDLAHSRGVHYDKLLKGTQLFYQDLAASNIAISYQQLEKLISNSQRLVPGKDLSFLLGRRFFPGNLGAIGTALANAKHLGEMVRIGRLFQQALLPQIFFNIRYHDGNAHFIFNQSLGPSTMAVSEFWAEFVATAMIGCFKWRNQRLPDAIFKFPFKQPDHYEQYQSHISCPCWFEQPFFSITISLKDFNLTQKDCSNTLKKHAVKALWKQNESTVGFVQYVFELISVDTRVSQQQLAAELNMSLATLKRKLLLHNTSYQKMLDKVRHQQAVFKIVEQQCSNEELATSLEIADTTNFRRSFKRWTGMTPNEMRLRFC